MAVADVATLGPISRPARPRRRPAACPQCLAMTWGPSAACRHAPAIAAASQLHRHPPRAISRNGCCGLSYAWAITRPTRPRRRPAACPQCLAMTWGPSAACHHAPAIAAASQLHRHPPRAVSGDGRCGLSYAWAMSRPARPTRRPAACPQCVAMTWGPSAACRLAPAIAAASQLHRHPPRAERRDGRSGLGYPWPIPRPARPRWRPAAFRFR